MNIYTEIGWGNPHFISTELEYREHEKRRAGCVPMRVTDVYCRLWLGRNVHILSWCDGYKVTHKNRRRFKFVLGIGGVRRPQNK